MIWRSRDYRILQNKRTFGKSNPDFKGLIHTASKEFENGALFIRLGLPSTPIRHETRSLQFRKRSLLDRKRLCVLVWAENILKTKLGENDRLRPAVLLY